MLLDLEECVNTYHLDLGVVVHAGAHLVEEAAVYEHLGAKTVMWIEAYPELIPTIRHRLRSYENQFVVQGLVTETVGQMRAFHVTNYDSMSSSIFPFGTHPQFSPDTVVTETINLPTTTIDWLCYSNDIEKFNTLVLDLQGAELLALKGARARLEHARVVYTEVNTDEVYVGCARLHEIDKYLADYGYSRVELGMVGDQGWGDALFVRK